MILYIHMFKASQEQIKDLLFIDDRILTVPKYQRPYTWSKDEIDDFWDDLVVSTSSFIGTFILNSENFGDEKILEIIDGQQRLLTITIFLAALRDVSKALGHSKLAERIQKKTIVTEDFSGRITYRVIVGESLRSVFSSLIQEELHSGDLNITSKEQKRVLENYEYLSEKIYDFLKISGLDNAEISLQKILEKLSSIDCVVIRINNDEDAYSIFETVNARGVDLSVADLLKNYIFKKLESIGKLNYGQEQWDKISANILDSGVEVQKFLRHFWLSKYGFVTERELYKEIKKSNIPTEVLVQELVESSIIYAKIYNNNLDDWADYEHAKYIQKTIFAVDVMGVSQCHVLFLSILRNAPELAGNLRRIFVAIEKFTFLYSGVSKLQANKVEKIYSKYAVNLEKEIKGSDSKNKQKNIQRIVEQLLGELKELSPGKSIFNEKFSEIQYKNTQKSRRFISYILSTIDRHDSTGELLINFDVVNIEHLLPQNPSSEWQYSKKDIKKYVNLLGNLVLVHREYNSKAGNRSIQEKCEILGETDITSTRSLINNIVELNYLWNQEQIIKRQVELADSAFELWSI